MIGIIDYGMGNLGSVTNALAFLNAPHRLLAAPGELAEVNAVILPGVGAFGDCMRHLREHGWVSPVVEWIESEKPFLGICLGLQVLFERSEESAEEPGLGVLRGVIRRFPPTELKVPQIGWNRLRQVRPECPLFRGVPDGGHVYFVHSYYADPADSTVTAGATEYGIEYTSMVWRGRLAAVQFHPEKSQRIGLEMLSNFIESTAARGSAA